MIFPRIGERARPNQLVGNAIKVEIRGSATANWYQPQQARKTGIEAAEIVLSPRRKAIIEIVHTVLSACATFLINGIAVFEVADFIRERDVVGMSRPGHACMLARRLFQWDRTGSGQIHYWHSLSSNRFPL